MPFGGATGAWQEGGGVRPGGKARDAKPALLQPQDASLERHGYRLGAIGRVEFLEHRAHVALDGALSDEQQRGDLLVGLAVSHELEHLDLAGGECGGADMFGEVWRQWRGE